MSARSVALTRPGKRYSWQPAFDGNSMLPTPAPWLVHHGMDKSEIEPFVVMNGGLATIAETRTAGNVDHQANADFIVRAVNNYEPNRKLIGDLLTALEHCLKNGRRASHAEQEARFVCARAKKALGS